MPSPCKYDFLEAGDFVSEEDLKAAIEESKESPGKIVPRGDNRFTVEVPEYSYAFDIDLNTGNTSKKIYFFGEAGILYNSTAEFYFLNPGDFSEPDEDFKIGPVEVTLGSGSGLIFLALGRNKEHYSTGYILRDYATIRLKNVNIENALDYLDKALFKIGICQDTQPSWPIVGTEDDSFPDESNYLEEFRQAAGERDLKHPQPLNSYNAAMRANNKHEEFLNLYKILEFYWDIAVNETMISLRKSRISDEEFIIKTSALRFSNELQTLTHLLENLMDAQAVEYLNDEIGLSADETKPSSLAEEIYEFRNSVVHAKEKKLDQTEPSERFFGEFMNYQLLSTTRYLGLRALERWGIQ